MKKEVLTKGQIVKLVDDFNNKQMKAIVSLLFMSGGRISEVLNIKARDLWRDEKYLYLKMILLKKRKANVQTEIIRKVKLNNYFEYFVNIIIDWVNKENNFEPDDFIFEYRRQTVWRKIKEKLPEANPHLFRHTLATIMGKKIDVRTMQGWFGWSNLDMATVYVQNKDAINTFADAVDSI